jgi:Flp pilus assembly protein TadB
MRSAPKEPDLSDASPVERRAQAAQDLRSKWLSAVFVMVWFAVVGLTYLGGPLWLVITLGVVGALIALYDRAYARSAARTALLLERDDK